MKNGSTHNIKNWSFIGYSRIMARRNYSVTWYWNTPNSPTFHIATVTAKRQCLCKGNSVFYHWKESM